MASSTTMPKVVVCLKIAIKTKVNIAKHKVVPIDMSDLNLSAIVFEANLVDNPRE